MWSWGKSNDLFRKMFLISFNVESYHRLVSISFQTCGILKTLARNLHVKASQVNLAIREAIVNGLEKTGEIVAFVRNFIIEKLSCDNFLSEKVSITFSCFELAVLILERHQQFVPQYFSTIFPIIIYLSP